MSYLIGKKTIEELLHAREFRFSLSLCLLEGGREADAVVLGRVVQRVGLRESSEVLFTNNWINFVLIGPFPAPFLFNLPYQQLRINIFIKCFRK